MNTLALSDAVVEQAWVLVPLGVFAFLTIGAIAKAVRGTLQTKAREESRREVAAYVAEGSMSPEDAERILSAGSKPASGRKCC